MGARSWSSSAPSVPSPHHHQSSSSSSTSTSTSSSATTTTAAAAAAAGCYFSSSSSSLSSTPSSSPPSSSSPSPTGGKKHHRHHNYSNNLQQLVPKQTTRNDRHAFFRIAVVGDGKKKASDVTPESVATAKAAVAAAAQRAERNLSVRRDLALDLPTCPALPDGEEKPYGSSTRLRIRHHDQESEIYQECIRPPPNRTVHQTSTSFPPFRCNSEGILTERPSPSGRPINSKTVAPSSSSSSSSSSHSQSYCSTSYSSSTSSLSSGSYGSHGYHRYRHLGGRPQPQQLKQAKQQAQPVEQQQHDHQDGLAYPAMDTGRLLLDIHGQPIVTRSKSLSTGSSLQQPDQDSTAAGSSSSCNMLAVMVPLPPPLPQPSIGPASKSLESTVKSCVRSFRHRVVHPTAKLSSATTAISCLSPPAPATDGGMDNAGFVESGSSGRWPMAALDEQRQQTTTTTTTTFTTTTNNNNSNNNNNNNNDCQATEEPSSSTSRSKLANLPVVPCASASTSYSSTSSSSPF